MRIYKYLAFLGFFLLCSYMGFSSEANLKIPDLHEGHFPLFFNLTAWQVLFYGSLVIVGTLGISLYLRKQVSKLPAHKSMLEVGETIFQTCRTYLIQQGKFLAILWCIISAAMVFYLTMANSGADVIYSTPVVIILVLLFSIVGIGGSYAVAWYGIRINTYANARTAFASLKKHPWDVVNIPLRSGISIGLFLISLELIMMVVILLFVPREIVGYCFLGFAIGESLGASALRIAGGIFTKIADIGSDLMKIVFKVKEDDPRNPGVIADCTGDNAGDSVGPTADAFETYGVTGVALITFITLAITNDSTYADGSVLPAASLQAKLIVWIFGMRFLMDICSGISYFINQAISVKKYGDKLEFDFEEALTRLIWIAAISCITISYVMSYFLIGDLPSGLWWKLASIISCGTLAAVLIPEFTKKFTSSKSDHVHEIVQASREGGSSLTILSGIVAGNFSAYWMGMLMVGLMTIAYFISTMTGMEQIQYAPIFAFGLVAFGFLCMGPVTIAVDSYGPVTDNAQSVFELSQIESIPVIK